MFGIRLKTRVEYFKRYRNILRILFKYGFGHIVEKLNIEHYFEYGLKITSRGKYEHREKRKLTGPQRLKLAFEELGPTFIKFGQVLSTRPDLIPLDYIKELQKLQDAVEPIPFEKIKDVIEKSYEEEIDTIFKEINPIPVGSASIAQVHRAVLLTGDNVVLKVKKPEIDHVIEIDIEILYNIALLIEKRLPELAYYNPVKMVAEFSKSIKREIDFTREAKNNDIVRFNFKGYKGFRVPDIYWEYTKENILVMEYVKGKKLSELIGKGFKSVDYSVRGANIFLKQILVDGFFHADPHPGNIFIDAENNIIFIDYGMTGSMDERDQENMAEILEGIVLKDVDKIIKGFKGFDTFPDNVNEKPLKEEIRDLLEKYHSMVLKNINIGKLMDEISQIIVRHKIVIPSDFFLVGKTLMTIEGFGRVLNPDFDMIEIVKPFIKTLLLRKYSTEKIFKRFRKNYDSYKELFENIPGDIKEILNKIKKDKISLEVHSREIQDFNKTVDRVMNRLVASIIIASIIVSSSMLIQSETGITVNGYSILGISGFIIAGVFGVIVLVDILRK